MRILKSKYFWFTILILLIGCGSAFVLNSLVGLPGLYCYMGGGIFIVIGILILMLLRQKELLRKLGRGDDSQRVAQMKWDESWKKSIDTHIDGIFTSIGNSKTRAFTTRKLYLTISEQESAFLDAMRKEAQILEILPKQGTPNAVDAPFQWLVGSDFILITLPQRLLQNEEMKEVRYLIHRLQDKVGLKCLAGLVFHGSPDPAKNVATLVQKAFRTILAECRLELPLYAIMDWNGNSVPTDSLLAKGAMLGKSFSFSRDTLPSVLLKTGAPAILDQARTVLLGKLTDRSVDQAHLQSGMQLLAALETRLVSYANFLDQVAKPTMDREGVFFRSLMILDSGVSSLVNPLSVKQDDIWGQGQFEDVGSAASSETSAMPAQTHEAVDGPLSGLLARISKEPFHAVLPSYRQSQLSTKALILTVLVAGFGILLAFMAIYSYSTGQMLESKWQSSFAKIQGGIQWDSWESRRNTLPILDSLWALNQEISGERPLTLAPGFYRSSTVLGKSVPLYRSLVGRLHQDAVRIRTESLRELLLDPVPEKSKLYNLLKTHLLFTTDGSSKFTDDESGIADTLASIWMEALVVPDENRDAVLSSLLRHSTSFVAELPEQPLAPDATDRALVQQSREILQDAGNIEALYQQILQDVNQAFPALTIDSLGLDASSGFSSNAKIEGVYTREAYDSLVKKSFSDVNAMKSDWVLGEVDEQQSGIGAIQLRNNLQRRYFQDYQTQWSEFLGSITFSPPSEAHDLSIAFKTLAQPSAKDGSGVRSFIGKLAYQLDYRDLGGLPSAASNSAVKGALKKIPGAALKGINGALNENFAQSIVDRYAYLFKLKIGIDKGEQDEFFADMLVLKETLAASTGDASAAKAYDFLGAAFSGDRGNPLNRMFLEVGRLFRDFSSEEQVLTNVLYLAPITAVTERLLQYTQEGLEKDYQESILKKSQALWAKFPLNRDASAEVEDDLLRSFLGGKASTLSEFQKRLDPFLEPARSGARSPKLWNDRKLAFSAKALEGLARLQRISDGLFAGNTDYARTQVRIQVPQNPRATIIVAISKRDVKVAPGEADGSLSVSWPPSEDDSFVLTTKTAAGEYKLQEQGKWSLLRTLWKYGRPDGQNRCLLDWRVKDKSYFIPVSLQFNFESSQTPFVDPYYFRIDLGRELFSRK